MSAASVHITINPQDYHDIDGDIPRPSQGSYHGAPPSYQEVTQTESRIPDDENGTKPDIDIVQVPIEQPPLPPLYEDVVRAERPFASHPEDAREWQDPGVACEEMFSKCITYWRILVFLGNIAGIVLLLLDAGGYDIAVSNTIGWMVFGVFYTAHIVETFCCNSNIKFLCNPVMVTDINEHVESVRSGTPSVVWRMECYHYERRTRTVTTGSGSNRSTRTESYTVKVTTWSGQKAFEFAYWDDVSDPRQLDTVGAFKRTRVKFSKAYVLSDSQTQEAFERQRNEFVAANRWRDTHHDLSESFEIVGFEPALLVSTTTEEPFFLKMHWYVLAVFLLLELPFSFMMRMQSTRMNYLYVKKLGIITQ